MQRRVVFPFSAIVGLDKLKLAILINAINPKVGGLLIRGPKGSGKTTAVRGLTEILPEIEVVKDCLYKCNPSDPSNMCPKCSERHDKGEKLPVEKRKMAVVNLPLGATEDRVVGSLDVEKAIKMGVEALEPGILAEANQNILYVDEINLLPDHIADDLLDAAATGWNVVEREGISVSHPSRFVFIGTMNPEEGELRPQLLDRFPLSASVERISSVKDRMVIVNRNFEFEKDPLKFHEKFRNVQDEISKRIFRAREILPKVEMPGQLLEAISKTSLDLKVDGMRPDIVVAKAASTLAAFESRTRVNLNDVLVAAELTLSHRTREGGFLEPATPDEIMQTLRKNAQASNYIDEDFSRPPSPKGTPDYHEEDPDPEGHERRRPSYEGKKGTPINKKFFRGNILKSRELVSKFFGKLLPAAGGKSKGAPEGKPSPKTGGEGAEGVEDGISDELRLRPGDISTVGSALAEPDTSEGAPLLGKVGRSKLPSAQLTFKVKRRIRRVASGRAGKRAETVSTLHRGRTYGWRFPKGKPMDVHLPATIRTAASRQRSREKPLNTALKICMEDVREKSRLYRAPMTIVFVTDLSGSMAFSLTEAKEAILKLHNDAYRGRDKVGIVALKGIGAVVVQHPITNLKVVASKLSRLRISGHTPLAAGMLKAMEVLKEAKRRDTSTVPVMAVISDGCTNVPLTRSLETDEIREFSEADIDQGKYERLASMDVVAVSKMIRKEGIYTVAVNTNQYLRGRNTYGFWVTRQIASLTGGPHHEVGRLGGRTLARKMFNDLSEDRRNIMQEASLSSRFK